MTQMTEEIQEEKKDEREIKSYYLIQVDGDPEFRLKAESARKDGAIAEFIPAGWVYQNRNDAEKIKERWENGKRKISITPWFDSRLDDIWYGSRKKSRLAKKLIQLEIESNKLNEKQKQIISQCYQSPLHPSWLYEDNISDLEAENCSENEIEAYKYFKPLWDQTTNEKKDVDLRNNDIAKEEEDIKNNIPETKIKGRSSRKVPQNNLPIVKIVTGQLHNVANQAERILVLNNVGIFQRGGQLVRIITEISRPKKRKLLDGEGKEIIKRAADALLITEVEPIYLTELLEKHANWTKYDERTGDWVLKDCPERISKTLIARREWDVPVLTGIIQAPTLRSDGSILDNPGYDEITGLFFNSGNTDFESIPAHPSKEEAIDALSVLRNLIKDFPFENEESESVAISAMLTGLIRKSIRSAPLHGFTAPKMGSGKSLLADAIGLIATGKNNSVIPQAEDESEEKKRLLAVLSEGDAIICYDNIERPFGSAALCSVLTQEYYKDRVLGSTRSLSVPTSAMFMATGNNLTFLGDTSTRVVLCRIDSQCERPEERVFDIDLRQYISQNRSALVKACLLILRAYHVAGRPTQNVPQYGRFEDWSNWVRSSLIWLGMKDPCATRKEIENSDPVRTSLIALLGSWYDYLGDYSFTIKKAISKAENEKSENEKSENFLDALKEFSSGKGEINTRSIGKNLSNYKNRIENGYKLENTGKYQGVDTWKVRKIN